MITWTTAAPLLWVTHGCITMYDELFLHRKRGLTLYEARLHWIDTALVVFVQALAVFCEPTGFTMTLYLLAAILSCLSITKEEWLHREVCSGSEHWLHAMMFMLHPLSLLAAGITWQRLDRPLIHLADWRLNVLLVYTAGTAIFLVYEMFYWRGNRLLPHDGKGYLSALGRKKREP